MEGKSLRYPKAQCENNVVTDVLMPSHLVCLKCFYTQLTNIGLQTLQTKRYYNRFFI